MFMITSRFRCGGLIVGAHPARCELTSAIPRQYKRCTDPDWAWVPAGGSRDVEGPQAAQLRAAWRVRAATRLQCGVRAARACAGASVGAFHRAADALAGGRNVARADVEPRPSRARAGSGPGG